MDPVQILLFIVVAVLTGLLVAVGMQAFLILQDVRRAIKKTNQLLDDAHILTNSIARPVQGFTHFIEGAKSIRHILDLANDLVDRKQEKHTAKNPVAISEPMHRYDYSPVSAPTEPEFTPLTKEEAYQYAAGAMEDEEAQYNERAERLLGAEVHANPIHHTQERNRRFFHRGGKSLSS